MSKRALLIGINYIGTSAQLSGCINDIMDLRIELLKRGYLDNNILVLTDNTVHKPTYDNILEGFKWLLSNSNVNEFKKPTTTIIIRRGRNIIRKIVPANGYKPLLANSKLVFHYSGHGAQVPDRNGDETDGYDETICPLDYNRKGFITDDLMRQGLLEKLNDSSLFAILDSCHSQSGLDLNWEIKASGTNSFELKQVNSTPALTKRAYLLSGCFDNDTSADIYYQGRANGALSRVLIDTLKQSPNISYLNLLNNIRINIKNLSRQVPCLTSCNFININDNLVW